MHLLKRAAHQRTLSPWQGYAVSLAAVGLALAGRFGLNAGVLAGKTPFILFFPAVLAAAVVCGFGPGLLATALSAGLANYFFVAPQREFSIDLDAVVQTLVFIGVGLG